MGCYTVPLLAAAAHFVLRQNIHSWRQNSYHLWLNLLFLGGSVFGIVDHIWNKDLLSFSFSDIMLGFAITLSIFIVWAGVVVYDKLKSVEKVTA